MYCAAAATIVGGALTERTRCSAYLIISVPIAALIYPVVGHWIWNGALSEQADGCLSKLGFINFASGTVVHRVGRWTALAALVIVGPLLGHLDGAKPPLRGSNYPVATVGVMVLRFGWSGFKGGGALG